MKSDSDSDSYSDSDSGPDLPAPRIREIGPPFLEGWLEWKQEFHPEAWFTDLVKQFEETIDVARHNFLRELHSQETAKWELQGITAKGGRQKRKRTVDGPGIWKQICGSIFRNFQRSYRDVFPLLSVILREQEGNTHRLVYLGHVRVTNEGFVWQQERNNDGMVHGYLQGDGDGPLLLQFSWKLNARSGLLPQSRPESWIANLQLALGDDSDLRIEHYHNTRVDKYGSRHASYISLYRGAAEKPWRLGPNWKSELYRDADKYSLGETVPGRLLDGLHDLSW